MRRAFLVVAAAVASFGIVGSAQAATIDVTRFDDPVTSNCPSDCSLRAAVTTYAPSLSGHDTVVLKAGAYTLTQGIVSVAIGNSVEIKGAGARSTTVTQSGSNHLFSVAIGGTGNFTSLTLAGGRSSNSAAALNNNGISSLNFVTLTDNDVVATGGDGEGGAIQNGGSMTINATTLTDNSAGSTIGVGRGGAIISYGPTLEIYNSTITGNTVGSSTGQAKGGGIYLVNGTLNLFNATVASNIAQGINVLNSPGGNIDSNSLPFNTIRSVNSVISGGTGGTGAENCGPNVDTATNDLGGNVEDRNQCGFAVPISLVNTNPQLGVLANNGGGTDTLKPAETSPVAGKAIAAECEDTDQRGGKRLVGGVCDSGAVELNSLADLELVGTAPASVNSGQPLAYDLVLKNNGPDNASGLLLSNDGNFSYPLLSSSPACTGASPLFRCPAGDLAVGATTPARVVVKAGTLAKVSTEWFVGTTDQNDPEPLNSHAQFTTLGGAFLIDMRLAKKKFKPARSGQSFAKASKRKRKSAGGTTLTYSTANATQLRLAVSRTEKGRKSKGKCGKRKRGKKSNCTRQVSAGRSTTVPATGSGKLKFSGRIGGKALRPGSYLLTATPIRSDGTEGPAGSAKFTIVR